ncbi:MAG: sigma-70 family RNA polymerase sigma factor [bacterium]|jgi:RNA polymerase sigma factor (sigma-70 family)|nr:sigma-70 family RNA polymerase sigma factor [candidate division KSB1 bacterium]MDH7561345.1 sigma-70 family RNA polymerase sigma factor [bacterium]
MDFSLLPAGSERLHEQGILAIHEEEFLRLLPVDEHRAWQLFVSDYSAFILRLIGHFVTDYDDRMELYLFVCQRLAANRLRRLKRFVCDPYAPCKLTTWLVPVIRNLVIDWFRHKEGRKRPSRCIAALPELTQMVFKYCYQQGYTPGEAFELIRTRHDPRLRFEEVSRALDQIHDALAGAKMWAVARAMLRNAPAYPVEGERASEDRPEIELSAPEAPPDMETQMVQLRRTLQEAIESLPAHEQLLLRLRFEETLSASEIADLLHLRDSRAAYQGIRQAIGHLRKRLHESGWQAEDFSVLLEGERP